MVDSVMTYNCTITSDYLWALLIRYGHYNYGRQQRYDALEGKVLLHTIFLEELGGKSRNTFTYMGSQVGKGDIYSCICTELTLSFHYCHRRIKGAQEACAAPPPYFEQIYLFY